MTTRHGASDEREILLQVGNGAFLRMKRWTRVPHVLKHFLNAREAWWQLGLTPRVMVEGWIAEFQAHGAVCGDEHVQVRLPRGGWALAQSLHDECYEPLYRIVLEGLASGDEHVEARGARSGSGRVDHELLCITVIYDEEGRVRSAYRPHTHPISSGLRGRQKNFVRAALLRTSLGQGGSAADGVSA